MTQPLNGIKPKVAPVVKIALSTLVLLAWASNVATLWSATARADEEASESAFAGPLPDIQAKTFTAKVVRRSSSNRTYLFDDPAREQPQVGRILLLRKDDKPVMAFRVLKLYPEENRFAAKRVRRYDPYEILKNGDSFLTIEKIMDIIPRAQTPEESADLKELEDPPPTAPAASPLSESGRASAAEEPSFDPDLDEAPPPSSYTDDEGELTPEEHRMLALTVEEFFPYDHHRHWLSAQAGMIRNYSADGGTAYYAGGGLRYGYSLMQLALFKKAAVQDSVVLEGSVFLYKLLQYATANDAYTVIPTSIAVRYHLHFSESLGLFAYAGLLKNWAIGHAQVDADALARLNSIDPALGLGLVFQIGPNWDTRIDLGFDMITAGLMLRF